MDWYTLMDSYLNMAEELGLLQFFKTITETVMPLTWNKKIMASVDCTGLLAFWCVW